MRRTLEIGVTCFGGMTFALIIGLAWVVFDSRGLPDMQSLAQFAPAGKGPVTDPCFNASSIAIPYDRIGNNMRSALGAAETSEDGPGVAIATYRAFIQPPGSNSVSLSMRIARTASCYPARQLDREMDEIRLAVQLEGHFSQRELFTIFANRLYLGENVVGVESASQYYFHKEPDQLTLGESALLVGLAKGPSRYSPVAHPDRALIRRNQVIDAMAERHMISDSEASAAKATPLIVDGD
jgi:membrane peptidoglycan carboxypeptidase